MPAVTVALNDFMDTVDKKAAHMKTVIGTMTASDEWQNADMFGKMDIAWDTLIGQPFADWISGDGKHLISLARPLFFREERKQAFLLCSALC